MSKNKAGEATAFVAPGTLQFHTDGNVYMSEDVYLSYENDVWYLHRDGKVIPYPTGFKLSASQLQ